MIPHISSCTRIPAKADQVFLIEPNFIMFESHAFLHEIEQARALSRTRSNERVIMHDGIQLTSFLFLKEGDDAADYLEQARLAGDGFRSVLKDHACSKLYVRHLGAIPVVGLAFAEGLALGSYQFTRYKKSEQDKPSQLEEIVLYAKGLDKQALARQNIELDAVDWARDLVNEPLNKLSAVALAETVRERALSLGINVEVLNKKRIESLRMGGLLAVNRGSQDPPTFSILEWKPEGASNDQPIILVGKGVVFDKGGISLKPANSMEEMKSDMAGAASVAAVICAVAAMKLPIHLMALIPATDNRPDGKAYVPGDIITMYDGSTVEVINTDAEGRLILADALAYASKFNPRLVINVATLTGSAARATGKLASVAMQSQASNDLGKLIQAGEKTSERLVVFPLWKEYDEMLRSDFADMKNVGGAEAGAITAGMFLKKFTNFPFIHLDIAGTAYLSKRFNYRGSGATGVPVRLLTEFLIQLSGE